MSYVVVSKTRDGYFAEPYEHATEAEAHRHAEILQRTRNVYCVAMGKAQAQGMGAEWLYRPGVKV